ncbi:coproporphyrinogen dehydrogenase HemZ [uncultured Merdimonas sp.]|uniref:coproporphyrinogen dehydrogenase HemZ n=1 Tax=uncultured Merdimonas sp. TaxID=2023269 RepID=UPI003209A441
MIRISCRDESYYYNAYHMVKAFFPGEEVVSLPGEKASPFVRADFADGSSLSLEAPAGVLDGAAKRELDRDWYHLLAKKTERKLPWGILTGVRPTKLAMQKRQENWEKDVFLEWFEKEYLVSKEKALLAWEIAGREERLLRRLDPEKGFSLYVGIPFCPTVCSYCSFSSGSLLDWKDRVDDYLQALMRELSFLSERCEGKKPDAVYIGGGTPTSLSALQLERLLDDIADKFDCRNLLEYTVEAGRPDTITEEKLKVIQEHGITRISVNPQTMQQKTLDLVGRKHTVQDTVEAFEKARRLGFDNINMDLIAGLPGEDAKDMQDTLGKIEALGPDSLTVHALAIKRAARMGREDQKAGTGDEIADMTKEAALAAERMGLEPYYLYRQKNIAGNFENVGYAKVDKAGIYNILIMEEKQTILAAGAGASSKIVLKKPCPMPGSRKKKMTNLIRIENVKAIDAYIDRIDEMTERKGEWLWR